MDYMCLGDGNISFFNDATLAFAPTPSQIKHYASSLKIANPIYSEKQSTPISADYTRLENAEAIVLFNHARFLPAYQPGHAHADTLSFEMSLGNQRIFVNSGISEYGMGHQRKFERSTAAHNTVEVNGENSSEVWGEFRVARRAKIRSVKRAKEAVSAVIDSPAGYQHQRQVQLASTKVTIEDRLFKTKGPAVAYLYLHPDVSEPIVDVNEKFNFGVGSYALQLESRGAEIKVVKTHWHPEYGKSMPNHCIKITFCEYCKVLISWRQLSPC
jgi:uncharacterized heparinase superfamily protein